jgi:hypothetical protein
MVGVDMAKKEFGAALFQEQPQALWGTFTTEVAGYKALSAQVSAACHQLGVAQVQLVIEALVAMKRRWSPMRMRRAGW